MGVMRAITLLLLRAAPFGSRFHVLYVHCAYLVSERLVLAAYSGSMDLGPDRCYVGNNFVATVREIRVILKVGVGWKLVRYFFIFLLQYSYIVDLE